MPNSQPVVVLATLWESIQPIDRGERYEDPLNELLGQHNLGEVCGGGSQLSDECGIEFVDIELELTDLQRGLSATVKILEALGAPKGSLLRYQEDGAEKTIEFGVSECVAVFLDGIGLPPEIYESTDINELADQIENLLAPDGTEEMRGFWSGPTETAIFLYGPDAEQLFAKLRAVLESYPLGQNARVVIRHGKPELHPRTVRIPMQKS